MRILIIEDDAKTADFVVRGFQKAGFQTCHCADGSAGLDKAKSEPFDAAVIDIMLPKMNGFDICAAFDFSPELVGKRFADKPVLAMEQLENFCREENIRLAILTVPAPAAQPIADRLAGCGIRAIWNFAPVILRVPDGVAVENENLASSLAILSKYVR